MRVRTVVKFRDLAVGKIRDPGEIFVVRDSRARELIALGYVKEIGEKRKKAAE